MASLWKIPSSRSTNKMLSGKVGRHKLYTFKLGRQQKFLVKAVMKCKSVDVETRATEQDIIRFYSRSANAS